MTINRVIIGVCAGIEWVTRRIAEAAYNRDVKKNEAEPITYTHDQLRDPATIIQVLKDLGWHRIGDSHTVDCPAVMGSGNRCNCVPNAPTWSAPAEVYKHLGEDWDSRLAARRAQKARQ